MTTEYDAVVVGSGPNGLAAAITLAREGWSVHVLEANATIGGATRSADLTLPGFVHDVGSAIHPLGAGSPFFNSLPLARFGLEWIQPEIALAHPLAGGRAASLYRNVDETAALLHGRTSRTKSFNPCCIGRIIPFSWLASARPRFVRRGCWRSSC